MKHIKTYKYFNSIFESNTIDHNILYHGTSNGGFDTFSYKYRGVGADNGSVGDYGKGFYFTPSKEEAIAYANGLVEEGNGDNPYLYSVELDIKKPFDMRKLNQYRDLSTPLSKKYGIMNVPQEEYQKIFNELNITEEDFEYMLGIEDKIGDNWADYDFEKIFYKKGFDGIISYDGNQYIVFRPDQIRIINKQPL